MKPQRTGPLTTPAERLEYLTDFAKVTHANVVHCWPACPACERDLDVVGTGCGVRLPFGTHAVVTILCRDCAQAVKDGHGAMIEARTLLTLALARLQMLEQPLEGAKA